MEGVRDNSYWYVKKPFKTPLPGFSLVTSRHEACIARNVGGRAYVDRTHYEFRNNFGRGILQNPTPAYHNANAFYVVARTSATRRYLGRGRNIMAWMGPRGHIALGGSYQVHPGSRRISTGLQQQVIHTGKKIHLRFPLPWWRCSGTVMAKAREYSHVIVPVEYFSAGAPSPAGAPDESNGGGFRLARVVLTTPGNLGARQASQCVRRSSRNQNLDGTAATCENVGSGGGASGA